MGAKRSVSGCSGLKQGQDRRKFCVQLVENLNQLSWFSYSLFQGVELGHSQVSPLILVQLVCLVGRLWL